MTSEVIAHRPDGGACPVRSHSICSAGFTASLPDISRTRFFLDVAPDPANCSVTYRDAYFCGPIAGIDITKATSGF